MARVNKRSALIFVEGTDFSGQISNFRITSAETESDFVTFEDAAAGGARDYNVEGTCAQDTDTASFWSFIWDASGDTVTGIYKPHGNAVASPTQPHYTWSATVKEPDGDLLGGDADASTTAVQTLDFAWPLDAKPVKVTS